MLNREDYLEKVTESAALRNLRESSIKNYRKMCDSFLDWCESLNVTPETILPEQVRKYILNLKNEKNYSPRTINTNISFINFFYCIALLKHFDKRILPKQKVDVTVHTRLTQEEIKKIIDNAPNLKARTMITLLYVCGLRCSELVNIRYSDVSRSAKHIHIRNSSKGRRDRYIPVSQSVIDLLTEYWIQYGRPKGYLFPGQKEGNHVTQSTVAAYVKKACAKLGWEDKNISTHTFRANRATHLFDQKVDIICISRFLGHASLSSTLVYLSIDFSSISMDFVDDILKDIDNGK